MREKRDTKNLNIKIDREVYEQLEVFCEEKGTSKTLAVGKILQKYFDEYFKRPKEERTLF